MSTAPDVYEPIAPVADVSHEVKLLLTDALELRHAVCLVGGHANICIRDCSPELMRAAELYGSLRTARDAIAEWQYVVVLGGLVTFTGPHQPLVRDRGSRGTGTGVDEESRSTIRMDALEAEALARGEGEGDGRR